MAPGKNEKKLSVDKEEFRGTDKATPENNLREFKFRHVSSSVERNMRDAEILPIGAGKPVEVQWATR